MTTHFEEIRKRSMADPRAFWAEAAKDIIWIEPYQTILDDSTPPSYQWFTGGKVNGCYNAIDRHVAEGRGTQPALIYDSAITGTKQIFTYADLQEETALCAGMLHDKGIGYGDRVIIYMPMIPQAVIAMLAIARIGAIHSVVFGGFAANELAKRIDDAQPKIILTASCGLEPNRIIAYKPLIDEALTLATHQVNTVILYQRPELTAPLTPPPDQPPDHAPDHAHNQPHYYDWQACRSAAHPHPCVPVCSEDPAYILYTSGTTGAPKGVIRPTAAHIIALRWTMAHIYDCQAGDIYWAASDIGWIVGHSYIVYAPLFAGCTTVLFEGKPVGTPDASTFWRVISEHKVNVMFTAPTAIRAIKKEDPTGAMIKDFDMSSLRQQFLAGERCDPDTVHWFQDKLGVPVIDHWWQTETGWAIASICTGIEKLPIKIGSAGPAVPGWDVRVLDEAGMPAQTGQIGSIVVKLPMPPGVLPSLWRNDQRYIDSYCSAFAGYYATGDAGYIDEDGYIFVMSRTDDIINVAGHRLSTGGMEEVLASHPDIAECAVIGIADDLKGQVPLGLLVLKSGVSRAGEDIIIEIIARVRAQIGPVASFKRALIVARLPKTRSGKILRSTIQKIIDGIPYAPPATIDDPVILEEIADAARLAGLIKT